MEAALVAPAATTDGSRSLPAERSSVTRKITVHGEATSVEMYVTVGFYPDGTVGEVFVKAAKKGSTLNGFAAAWARMVSVALHQGLSWEKVRDTFTGTRFEPAGATHSSLGIATSPVDAIVRFVEQARLTRAR